MSGLIKFLTGADQAQQGIQKGLNQYNQYSDKGVEKLNPWQETGQDALSKLMASLNEMQNPQSLYDQTMNGYEMSPYAKMMEQEALKASNQAASASGMLGTPQQQHEAARYAHDITSADMQNYYDNLMGIRSGYMKGLDSLSGQGFNSAAQQANMYGNQATANMQGQEDIGRAGQQGMQDFMSMLTSGAGAFGQSKYIPNFAGSQGYNPPVSSNNWYSALVGHM